MHAKTLCAVLPGASQDPVPPTGTDIAERFPSLGAHELFHWGHVWFCTLKSAFTLDWVGPGCILESRADSVPLRWQQGHLSLPSAWHSFWLRNSTGHCELSMLGAQGACRCQQKNAKGLQAPQPRGLPTQRLLNAQLTANWDTQGYPTLILILVHPLPGFHSLPFSPTSWSFFGFSSRDE